MFGDADRLVWRCLRSSQSSEGCTALTFATECAPNHKNTLESMKLLIAADLMLATNLEKRMANTTTSIISAMTVPQGRQYASWAIRQNDWKTTDGCHDAQRDLLYARIKVKRITVATHITATVNKDKREIQNNKDKILFRFLCFFFFALFGF